MDPRMHEPNCTAPSLKLPKRIMISGYTHHNSRDKYTYDNPPPPVTIPVRYSEHTRCNNPCEKISACWVHGIVKDSMMSVLQVLLYPGID